MSDDDPGKSPAGDESKVRELFAPLQEPPIDVEGRRFPVDRDRIVKSILKAPADVASARAARSRRITMLAMAACLALVAGSAGWWAVYRQAPVASVDPSLRISGVRGQVTRLRGATEVGVVPGEQASVPAEGELVTAAQSEASVATARGLEIRLFENSRIRLSDLDVSHATNAVHLDRGGIRCKVPHLADGQQFSVVTPDATVVVHGTVFRVEIGNVAGASKTCVRVEEGVVSVRGASSEARLTAGESAGCEPSTAPAPASPPPSAPPAVTSAPQLNTPSKPPVARVEKETGKEKAREVASTLNEENALFQSGLASERAGDSHAAKASFEQLLSRYPQSPLAAEARAALARLERNAKHAP